MRLIGQHSDAESRPPTARLRGWMQTAWNIPKQLRRKRGTVASGQGSKLDILDQVIQDLRDLNHNTEQDFLGIGGKLMDFLREAESISSGLTRLTVQISGAHGNHASEVLTHALERCRLMESSAVERSRSLASLRDGAHTVRGTFSGFANFLSTFRVLNTLTRIETARLVGTGADFRSLTEDVKSLAEGMGSKVENVLAAVVRLDERVKQTVAVLSEVDVVLKDLSLGISRVKSSLGSFSEQQADAAKLSTRLAADSRSVSASITDAVMSIQFHDITRQQTEHVIEALQRVSSTRKSGPNLSREATAVLTLEAAQLSNAEAKFGSSVERLLHDLDNIGACVREMARNGSTLLAASGDEKNPFFLEMENCMTAILNAVGSYTRADTATEAAAGELNETLGSMRHAAQEVYAIDLQLSRLALNASIQAAHLGASGDTLSTLAVALQDLAIKSRQRSNVVGEALHSMSADVGSLSQKADHLGFAKVPSSDDFLFGEMRSTIKALHSWSEASFVRIKETTTQAAGLCNDISAGPRPDSLPVDFSPT